MSTPSTVTVVGTFTGRTGSVRLVRSVWLRSSVDDSIVGPERHVATLDEDGHVSLTVPCSDDEDWTPQGFSYTLVVNLNGSPALIYDVILNGTEDDIELADLLPVVATGGAMYAPLAHTHAGGGAGAAWDDITGKPADFPPSAHTHIVANVTNLQTLLDGKEAAGSVTAHEALSNPHPTYLTQAEADALYAVIGSGTFPLSHWGLTIATGDPGDFGAQSPLGNNTVFIMRAWVPAGVSITNLWIGVAQAGSGHDGSSNPNRLFIYDNAGVKLGETADDPAMYLTNGWRGGPLLGGTIAAQATGRWVYLGAIARGYSSSPGVGYVSSPNDFPYQWVGPGQTHRRTVYMNGQTSVPASITPGTTGTPSGYCVLMAAS